MAVHPKYIPAQKPQVVEVILALFARRYEFLRSIAPNGFENSDLVFVYRAKLYESYLYYRLYHMRSYSGRQREMPKSSIEFAHERLGKDLALIDSEMESTLFMGALTAIIFDYPHVVYNGNMESFRLGPPYCAERFNTGEFLHRMLYEAGILPQPYSETFNVGYFGGYGQTSPFFKGVNIRPACRFIFAFLKEMGLSWDFGSTSYGYRDVEIFRQRTDYDEIEPEYWVICKDDHRAYDPEEGFKSGGPYDQDEDDEDDDEGENTEEVRQTLLAVEEALEDSENMWETARFRVPFIRAFKEVYGVPPRSYPPFTPGRDM